jgi:hypothetical protein
MCINLDCKRIDFRHYQEIEIGMTRQQVDRILGTNRFEVKPINRIAVIICDDCMEGADRIPDEWWGVHGMIRVVFENDRVASKAYVKHRCEVEPFTVRDRILELFRVLPRS